LTLRPKNSDRRLWAIKADSTNFDDIQKVAATVGEEFHGLDVVSANAGVGGKTPIGEATVEAFEQILKTDLTCVFFLVQAVTRFLTSGASVILNGSIHSVLGIPGYSGYAASKAGLRAMARVLTSELYVKGSESILYHPERHALRSGTSQRLRLSSGQNSKRDTRGPFL
jgi:NAD(P)-dependent dehydrogenase (short-subunit alcohol dehydrogenase family)